MAVACWKIILRDKVNAVSDTQFVTPQELLHSIRAAFEETDIPFAYHEVTLRVNEVATPKGRQDVVNVAASAEQPAT